MNVWFCKALQPNIANWGMWLCACMFVVTPRVLQFFSAQYFSLILYQSLVLQHVAIGFLNSLCLFLFLSCPLTPLSVDLLSVCARENETVISKESQIMRMKMRMRTRENGEE